MCCYVSGMFICECCCFSMVALVAYNYSVTYTVVSRKYAPPPFATLSLVQNAGGGGGLYTGCDNFSCDYTLPSGHEVIVGGGGGPSTGRCRARGGEMLTMLAVGSLIPRL